MNSLSRRSLITGFVGLIAAPAIVRASSLMPIKPWKPWHEGVTFKCTERFLKGPFGTVAFAPAMATDPQAWALIGAGEKLYPGDLIHMARDGLAYQMRPSMLATDEIIGMVLSSQ